jgi:hypothetical protein
MKPFIAKHDNGKEVVFFHVENNVWYGFEIKSHAITYEDTTTLTNKWTFVNFVKDVVDVTR